ncbi:MAG TPA: hypothetical protein VJB14_01870 [Planctomycetota bacterium]|nr:hypothetical protein [Planctomycetota bacterium]
MRIYRALPALVLLAGIALAQERPVGPWEVLLKHEKALKAIPGLLEMTVAAVNGEKRIVIRVENDLSRDAVRARLGEKIEGFPVHILVSRPAPSNPAGGACGRCPLHCKGTGQTVATPAEKGTAPGTTKFDMGRIDDPAYVQEKCDILRKWSGLPKRSDGDPFCIEMVSWTNDFAKVKWVLEQGLPHWRSKEMAGLRGSDSTVLVCADHGNHGGGEILCYTWIKHRQFCPLGMKQVLKEIQENTPTRGSRP